MMHRDRGGPLSDNLTYPVDHRRDRFVGRPNSLRENQFAVVYAKQWLQRQLGAQPRARAADASATSQIVQLMHDDEPVVAVCRGRGGRGDGVQVGAIGGGPRRRHRDEAGVHPGELRVENSYL